MTHQVPDHKLFDFLLLSVDVPTEEVICHCVECGGASPSKNVLVLRLDSIPENVGVNKK